MADGEQPERGRAERRPIVRQGSEPVTGSRAGDSRIRLARAPETQRIDVPRLAPKRRTWHPAVVFSYTFGVLILLGAFVLMLPVSSASGIWTPFLTALFTSTSAVTLTGLIVVDTGTYWSPFGQAVILLLFQLGGLGFMTSSTMLLLLFGYSATLRHRLLLREALGGGSLGSVLRVARNIAAFTFIVEAIGALILTGYFLTRYDPVVAIWWGIFHSVSGFNNAGFDLVGGFQSLSPFKTDAIVLTTIAILMTAGAVSYTVVDDIIRRRHFVRLALDTKLVLVTTAGLLVTGFLAMLFTERNNPFTLGPLDMSNRLLNAFFLSASRTGGFSTVDIGQLTDDGMLVMMALMFIGGAAGSTAGGVKVQTFSILLFAIIATVRGRSKVEAFRRQVPTSTMMRAQTVALLAVASVFLFFFILNVSERFAFNRVLFEVVSAFGTVGLSTGITPELSDPGRIIVIVVMFVGRLGPLTLALALAARAYAPPYQWPEESIRIG